MDLSGQIHAPAALPREKKPLGPIGWASEQVLRCREENKQQMILGEVGKIL
jgi:hypothetical protein